MLNTEHRCVAGVNYENWPHHFSSVHAISVTEMYIAIKLSEYVLLVQHEVSINTIVFSHILLQIQACTHVRMT